MSNRLCYVRYTGNNATDFCDYTSRIFGEFTGIGVVMDRTGMDVPDKDMSKYMNVQNGVHLSAIRSSTRVTTV